MDGLSLCETCRLAAVICIRLGGYPLDWAQTLALLGAPRLDADVFERSLGAVLKYPEDIETARAGADSLCPP